MAIRIVFLAALIPLLLTGCSSMRAKHRSLAKPYEPANVFVRQTTLPQGIRRVAVLPLPRSREDANQAEGARLLEPVLLAELSKRSLFELVPVSPDQLRASTGSSSWEAEDKLPADFFDRLRQATGCDAVIFASLTTFQAYPPLRIGWKVRLVDCATQTWWAFDDVFDGGSNAVIAAANSYARTELNLPNALLEDTGVLHSPRRFGQYTVHALALTLPSR